MKTAKYLGLGVAAFALPLVTFAQADADLGFFGGLIDEIQGLIDAAVPLVVGLAILLFLWGLAKYILSQDDAESRANARSIMIWGVVIIFVMTALWGLVGLLSQLTGVDEGDVRQAPTLPSGGP